MKWFCLLFSLLLGVASWTGLADGDVSIISTAPDRIDGYGRISTNTTSVLFWPVVNSEPMVHDECMLLGCTYRWSITPEPQGFDSPLGLPYLVVPFGGSANFGKHYQIDVVVTWSVADVRTGDVVGFVDRRAVYVLDAILYTFDVACSDGTACAGNVSTLVDNHPAEAHIMPIGCTRPDLLRMFIRSRPEESNPRNKAGTAMNFVRTADPCVLTTYKTYWYGLEHPNDCFFNQYYYDLTLTSDSEAVAKIRKTVGWPDSEAEFVYSAVLSNYDLKVQRISPNYVLLAVSNCFFEITSEIHHTTSQYAEETDKEEMFHEKQIRGLVGKEDGGFPGLFSTGFALSNLLFSCDGGNNFSQRIFVLNSETISAIRLHWVLNIENALKTEYSYSLDEIEYNRGCLELKAKEHARYGEAYRYECTYGNPLSGCRYYGNAEDLTPWSGR